MTDDADRELEDVLIGIAALAGWSTVFDICGVAWHDQGFIDAGIKALSKIAREDYSNEVRQRQLAKTFITTCRDRCIDLTQVCEHKDAPHEARRD